MNKPIEQIEFYNEVAKRFNSSLTNQQYQTVLRYLRLAINKAPNKKVKDMLRRLELNAHIKCESLQG